MNQKEVLRLCEVLVSLNKAPEPGIGSWHEACTETVNELRAALGAAPVAGGSLRMAGVIETDERSHVYTVKGSVPPPGVEPGSVVEPGLPRRRNVAVTVVTTRVERAIEVARKLHPEITVHDVVHRCGGRLFVDTERV